MYSSTHTYNACDYVSVFGTRATVNNGVFTWDIPPEYFSNQRGTLCTVQIVSGSIQGTSMGSIALLWMSGAANANHCQSPVNVSGAFPFKVSGDLTTAKMTNTPIIGTASEGIANSFQVFGGPEFITAARPSQIRIGFTDLTSSSNAADFGKLHLSNNGLCLALVFKFTYYAPVTSALDLHNPQYTKQL